MKIARKQLRVEEIQRSILQNRKSKVRIQKFFNRQNYFRFGIILGFRTNTYIHSCRQCGHITKILISPLVIRVLLVLVMK